MLFKVKAETVKPFSPRMFSKTEKVYASAKHSVIRDMYVDQDELVFTLAQSLFLFLKKDFLNSPTKIFFKMAAKLAKTAAILREKTPNPELRPLFRCNDWTRCYCVPPKILISQQQLILEHLTWYQTILRHSTFTQCSDMQIIKFSYP